MLKIIQHIKILNILRIAVRNHNDSAAIDLSHDRKD